jgi:hypothetical protein
MRKGGNYVLEDMDLALLAAERAKLIDMKVRLPGVIFSGTL